MRCNFHFFFLSIFITLFNIILFNNFFFIFHIFFCCLFDTFLRKVIFYFFFISFTNLIILFLINFLWLVNDIIILDFYLLICLFFCLFHIFLSSKSFSILLILLMHLILLNIFFLNIILFYIFMGTICLAYSRLGRKLISIFSIYFNFMLRNILNIYSIIIFNFLNLLGNIWVSILNVIKFNFLNLLWNDLTSFTLVNLDLIYMLGNGVYHSFPLIYYSGGVHFWGGIIHILFIHCIITFYATCIISISITIFIIIFSFHFLIYIFCSWIIFFSLIIVT